MAFAMISTAMPLRAAARAPRATATSRMGVASVAPSAKFLSGTSLRAAVAPRIAAKANGAAMTTALAAPPAKVNYAISANYMVMALASMFVPSLVATTATILEANATSVVLIFALRMAGAIAFALSAATCDMAHTFHHITAKGLFVTGVATAVIAVISKDILSPLGLAHGVITGVGMALFYGLSLIALKK